MDVIEMSNDTAWLVGIVVAFYFIYLLNFFLIMDFIRLYSAQETDYKTYEFSSKW